eukprot:m.153995 g.153995  ORF g.153995 m.153995 type:complete len:59 (+) comp16377_c0_seq10:1273-1449(+)
MSYVPLPSCLNSSLGLMRSRLAMRIIPIIVSFKGVNLVTTPAKRPKLSPCTLDSLTHT